MSDSLSALLSSKETNLIILVKACFEDNEAEAFVVVRRVVEVKLSSKLMILMSSDSCTLLYLECLEQNLHYLLSNYRVKNILCAARCTWPRIQACLVPFQSTSAISIQKFTVTS